jgi:hypothetical protein
MPTHLQPIAEAAAEEAVERHKALAAQVLEKGGTPNDKFSIHAHVLAHVIDFVVERMKVRANEVNWDSNLPTEAFVGILLNDAMERFWMKRKREGRE